MLRFWLWLLPTVAFGAAPGGGQISGKVSNGTAGGANVEGVEVTLFASGTHASGPSASVRTDRAGDFVFSDLDRDSTAVYYVGARYQNVPYVTDPIHFVDLDLVEIEVPVFDATDRPESIRFEGISTFVDEREGGFWIRESFFCVNTSDRTFIRRGAGLSTFQVDLPLGARDLQSGGDLLPGMAQIAPGGLTYLGPIHPGRTMGAVAYFVPEGEILQWDRTLPFSADQIDVHAGAGVPGLVNSRFTPSSQRTEGHPFSSWTGAGFGVGQTVRMSFVGAADGRSGPVFAGWILGGLLAALGLWGTVNPLLRASRDDAGAAEPGVLEPTLERLERERLTLLGAVRDLDQDFEMDKLSNEDYVPLRGELRDRAIAVMKRLEELRPSESEELAEAPAPGLDRETWCTQCGRAIRDGDRYCGGCGKLLATESGV